ncbi:GYD domain-containing protein [Nocardioides mesophilus]|uniref:GYD domain-containing protein n=1 Tax=Nocardioides mesophilus TaxID=433659 RepID=A0A7G9R966_9ACTN|nr:GYD domain-containing protein [Nocardioides mesophilus]QNN52141.1 GYD domain-containing protein [Nocardioides mesophilus]
MAKYLLKVSYSAQGLKGVMKSGGTSRVKAVEHALAGVGGSLESFYFAFGGDDVYVIADVPDHAAAMAMAAAVASSGAISSYETVVLLSPSEVDDAMKVAVDYAPPGS